MIGAVKAPGTYQLQGYKTLIEMLSMAGGLADDAGGTVKITRRLEWGQGRSSRDGSGHSSWYRHRDLA